MRYCNVIFNQTLLQERPYLKDLDSIRNYTKVYTYKTDIKGLRQGDLVVVPTGDSFNLGVFVCYNPILNGIKAETVKPIIQHVDLTEYYNHLEIERKKKELIREMEERRKSLEEKLVYEMLAEKDSTMAMLLKQLNALNGGK